MFTCSNAFYFISYIFPWTWVAELEIVWWSPVYLVWMGYFCVFYKYVFLMIQIVFASKIESIRQNTRKRQYEIVIKACVQNLAQYWKCLPTTILLWTACRSAKGFENYSSFQQKQKLPQSAFFDIDNLVNLLSRDFQVNQTCLQLHL